MQSIVHLKQAVLAGCSAAAGAAVALFGGSTIVLKALLIFMAADYLSGVLAAAVFKKSGKTDSGALCSKAGFVGLARKAGILLMLLVANQLDLVLGTPYIQSALSLFLLGNEGLSVLENLGLMGVPYPDFLRRALDALLKTPE